MHSGQLITFSQGVESLLNKFTIQIPWLLSHDDPIVNYIFELISKL